MEKPTGGSVLTLETLDPTAANPLMAQWLAKADNLFLGLALSFHLVDIADTQIPRPGETLADAAKVPSLYEVALRIQARAIRRCGELLKEGETKTG